MSAAIKRLTISRLSVITFLCLSSCVAVSITPPLSGNGQETSIAYQGVAFTTGTFKRPHRIIGVVQMTQEGFRHYLAGEANEEDTQVDQMMQAIARYAAHHGADGLQQFSLIDENPRSREERTAQQVGQTIKIVAALAASDPDGYRAAAHEGEETRYHIKGELVAWEKQPPTPTAPTERDSLTEEAEPIHQRESK